MLKGHGRYHGWRYLLSGIIMLQLGTAVGLPLYRRTVLDWRRRGALCNDNSSYIFYVSQSSNFTTKWIIYLEGGGGCSTPSDCEERYQSERSLMTSKLFPSSVTGDDVLSSDKLLNPAFYDHNRVLLPYCSSDLWLAGPLDNLTEWDPAESVSTGSSFTFHGARIFRLVIEDLIATNNFSQASHVVFAGTSAGGVGAANHAEWLRSRLLATKTPHSKNALKLSVLVDSAWFIDFRDSISSRFGGALITTASSLMACKEHFGKMPCCSSLQCLLERNFFSRETPLFVLQSSFDIYVLGEALRRQVSQPDLTLKKARRAVVLYRAHTNSSLTALKRQFTKMSVFEVGCSQHGYFAASSLWTTVYLWRRQFLLTSANGQLRFSQERRAGIWLKINGSVDTPWAQKSIATAISEWWRAGRIVSSPENCVGLLCHSVCPETVDAQPDVNGGRLIGSHWIAVTVAFIFPACSFLGELVLVYLGRQLNALDRLEQLSGQHEGMPDCEDGNFDITCTDATYAVQVLAPRHLAVAGALVTALTDSGKRKQLGEECLDKSKRANKPPSMSPVRYQTKMIINQVSVSFAAGHLCAVMGPSGSGKSTLLNLLAGRRQATGGKVSVNGCSLSHPSTQQYFVSNCGYVPQLEHPYYGNLTVRQNVLYSAFMRLPANMTPEEKVMRVNMAISEVGLTEQEDVVVGGLGGGGLSGGQKRRLCVALQLLSLPAVLVLDEPTSGLDSFGALDLVMTLKIVARGQRLVLLTIHQPRIEIFHLFDKILLLCNGQVAFYGEPNSILPFFKEALPESEHRTLEDSHMEGNLANIMLDMLSVDNYSKLLINTHKDHAAAFVHKSESATVDGSVEELRDDEMYGIPGPCWWQQLISAHERIVYTSTATQRRFLPIVLILFGLVDGIVFYKSSAPLQVITSFVILINSPTLVFSPIAVTTMTQQLEMFFLESRDGLTSSWKVILVVFQRLFVWNIPFLVIALALNFFLTLPSDFKTAEAFILVLLVIVSLSGTWWAVYIFIVCLANNPDTASQVCQLVSALAGFSSGFLITKPLMPVYFRFLFYINPVFWSLSAVMRFVMEGKRFSCRFTSQLDCQSQDGNTVLILFGFEELQPFSVFYFLFGLSLLSLVGSVITLEVKVLRSKDFSNKEIFLHFINIMVKKIQGLRAVQVRPADIESYAEASPHPSLFGNRSVEMEDDQLLNVHLNLPAPSLFSSTSLTNSDIQLYAEDKVLLPGVAECPPTAQSDDRWENGIGNEESSSLSHGPRKSVPRVLNRTSIGGPKAFTLLESPSDSSLVSKRSIDQQTATHVRNKPSHLRVQPPRVRASVGGARRSVLFGGQVNRELPVILGTKSERKRALEEEESAESKQISEEVRAYLNQRASQFAGTNAVQSAPLSGGRVLHGGPFSGPPTISFTSDTETLPANSREAREQEAEARLQEMKKKVRQSIFLPPSNHILANAMQGPSGDMGRLPAEEVESCILGKVELHPEYHENSSPTNEDLEGDQNKLSSPERGSKDIRNKIRKSMLLSFSPPKSFKQLVTSVPSPNLPQKLTVGAAESITSKQGNISPGLPSRPRSRSWGKQTDYHGNDDDNHQSVASKAKLHVPRQSKLSIMQRQTPHDKRVTAQRHSSFMSTQGTRSQRQSLVQKEMGGSGLLGPTQGTRSQRKTIVQKEIGGSLGLTEIKMSGSLLNRKREDKIASECVHGKEAVEEIASVNQISETSLSSPVAIETSLSSPVAISAQHNHSAASSGKTVSTSSIASNKELNPVGSRLTGEDKIAPNVKRRWKQLYRKSIQQRRKEAMLEVKNSVVTKQGAEAASVTNWIMPRDSLHIVTNTCQQYVNALDFQGGYPDVQRLATIAEEDEDCISRRERRFTSVGSPQQLRRPASLMT